MAWAWHFLKWGSPLWASWRRRTPGTWSGAGSGGASRTVGLVLPRGPLVSGGEPRAWSLLVVGSSQCREALRAGGHLSHSTFCSRPITLLKFLIIFGDQNRKNNADIIRKVLYFKY